MAVLSAGRAKTDATGMGIASRTHAGTQIDKPVNKLGGIEVENSLHQSVPFLSNGIIQSRQQIGLLRGGLPLQERDG